MKQLFDRLRLDWDKLPKVTRITQYMLAFSVAVYCLLLVIDGVGGAVYSFFGILMVGTLGAMMCMMDHHWTFGVLDLGLVGLLYLITSLMNP